MATSSQIKPAPKQSSAVRKKSWPELPKPIAITINTKVPTKWLFIDCETGETYRHNGTELERVS